MKTNFKTIPLIALKPKKGDSKSVDSEKAHHFAVGSVLGDGAIHKTKGYLETGSKSPYYSLWKREEASEAGLISIHQNTTTLWSLKPSEEPVQLPLTVKTRKTKGREKDIEFSFVTRAVFREPIWRTGFYSPVPPPIVSITGKKVKAFRKSLPSNLKEVFWSDYALTIFYLDDGSYDTQKKTVRLSAGEWTLEECKIMQDCLLTNFNISTALYLSRGVPHHFYVEKASYPVFYRKVLPTIQKFVEAYPEALNCSGIQKKLRLLNL